MELQDSEIIKKFFTDRPKTNKALQHFVQSCAKANAAKGKKTLFGKSKYEPALEKLNQSYKNLCAAIDIDGDMFTVDIDSSWAELKKTGDYAWYIDRMIKQFKLIYPNWRDAYSFWNMYIVFVKK